MPTMDEYAKKPLAERVARLARTPDEVAAAIRDRDDASLSRRPDPKNWAAKEVICHLRDTEESFYSRFEQILAMDDPKFLALNPDRWAEERQYLQNDAAAALGAFGRRRAETLAFLGALDSAKLARGGIHATRGRMTIGDLVSLMAWHDDNHVDQLRRALEGKA